ncbi:MAG: hypothetical protein MPW15_06275 [Candidatus Manganitrophus sp.]|nr:hypothetical protein [Candidatus Manganitrophus sp.]
MSGKERMQKALPSPGLLTDHDIYLLKEGSHFKLHDKLGAHLIQEEGIRGVYFALWAPNAESVSVIGDFNGWNRTSHPLRVREDGSGVWEGFFNDIGMGALYKYHLASRHHHYTVEKGDPFAFCTEIPPGPPRSSGISTINGAITFGWRSAPNAAGSPPPSPFMRCTSAPGGGSLKRETGR